METSTFVIYRSYGRSVTSASYSDLCLGLTSSYSTQDDNYSTEDIGILSNEDHSTVSYIRCHPCSVICLHHHITINPQTHLQIFQTLLNHTHHKPSQTINTPSTIKNEIHIRRRHCSRLHRLCLRSSHSPNLLPRPRHPLWLSHPIRNRQCQRQQLLASLQDIHILPFRRQMLQNNRHNLHRRQGHTQP